MLIGLHSKGRQAGKDTAASYIDEWCRAQKPYKTYQRLAFADIPKLLVAEILPLGKDLSDTKRLAMVDQFKLTGRIGWSLDGRSPAGSWLTGRDFIINLCGEIGGEKLTGARKLFGESFWTDIVLPTDWESATDITVVTDVRADEEADRIRWLGGEIWEIRNPRVEEAGGRSEKGLSIAPEREIWNTGTLDEFKDAVCGVVDTLWHHWHMLH